MTFFLFGAILLSMNNSNGRLPVWFQLQTRSDVPMIREWLDENTSDSYYWFFVPGSPRRRVEFTSEEDANNFRAFLSKEDIIIISEEQLC